MILKMIHSSGGIQSRTQPIIETASTTTASNIVIPKFSDSLTWWEINGPLPLKAMYPITGAKNSNGMASR